MAPLYNEEFSSFNGPKDLAPQTEDLAPLMKDLAPVTEDLAPPMKDLASLTEDQAPQINLRILLLQCMGSYSSTNRGSGSYNEVFE